MTIDLEGFAVWLRAQGTPDPNVEVYRRGAEVLSSFANLDAALTAEEAAGASPRRLANLREVAEKMRLYGESRPAPPVLDIAPVRRERPAPSTRREIRPPRPGCDCREHHEVFLDNDWGIWGKAAGGIAGVGGVILSRLVGLLGALTVALALAGVGGLATTLSVCFRCDTCRRPIRGSALDADERADLRKARGLIFLVTLGLLGGAAVGAFIWWSVVSHRDA